MTAAALPVITRDEAEAGRYFDVRPPFVQELMRARDRRVLVDGPLGTGKTRVNLERMRACCLRYPRCRWLLGRSVRKWLTASALVTWEEKVIVPGELLPDRIRRESRSEYRFRNGSVVVVSGFDDPQGVFSAEYDGAVLVEAIELDQDTAEKIDGRLRYGRMPYQQMLMDCNPGAPTHWLHKAFETGWCRRLAMRHADNPALYLPDGVTRTRFGRDYLARLDDLTGVRRDRLRDGKWVQAEGVVYDGWDVRLHVIDPFAIPQHWQRLLSIDFGYTNPFVCQWWAKDPDGRLFLYREIYRAKVLVEDHAKEYKRLSAGEPVPTAVVCDHDAEDRATWERHTGLRTVAAPKAVDAGIQSVAARLKPAGDGKPRLFVFRNALVERDAALALTGKPTCTADEIDGYVWKDSAVRDVPVKEDDHGADALRYISHYCDQPKSTFRVY